MVKIYAIPFILDLFKCWIVNIFVYLYCCTKTAKPVRCQVLCIIHIWKKTKQETKHQIISEITRLEWQLPETAVNPHLLKMFRTPTRRPRRPRLAAAERSKHSPSYPTNKSKVVRTFVQWQPIKVLSTPTRSAK